MAVPTIKKWVLSPHALERIQERKVTAQELALVIERPQVTLPQGAKWIFAKALSGRNDIKVAAVLLEREEKGV